MPPERSVALPKLLVVDDDPAVAELIRLTACDAGFDASSSIGNLDLHSALAKPPDLLVIDLQMPGRDGVELIRDLSSAGSQSAVFLVSGLGDRMLSTAVELAEAKGLRVLGSLGKPFSDDELFSSLSKARSAFGAAVEPAMAEKFFVFTREELEAALDLGQIEVWYQPIVTVSNGRQVSAEALSRWHHPELGLLPPSAFIPLMQSYGLLGRMNWMVLETVLRDMKAFPRRPVPISVNFNACDLTDVTMPDRLARAVHDAGLPLDCIKVELTEGNMIEDLPSALDTMMRLRMKGIKLLLDDFGTGYSAMEKLRRLPLSALKIDRSFLPLQPRPEDEVLLESLVSLAHQMGLPAIAEGVETRAQLELLQRLGCDEAQGYYLAMPMPISQFRCWTEGFPAVAAAC